MKWISRVLHTKADLLSNVKPATKNDFTSRIKEAYKQNKDKVDIRQELDEIAKLAGVKLPRLEKTEKKQEE